MTDLTYILFAMAIIGIFFLVILSFSFILPALFYNKGIDEKIKQYLNQWFFLVSISIFPIFVTILLMCGIYYHIKFSALEIVGWFFSSVFLFLFLFHVFIRNEWRKFDFTRKIEIFSSMFMLTIIGYIPVIVFIIFVLSKQSNISTNEDALITFFIFYLFTLISNFFSISEKIRNNILNQVTISIIMIFIMMLFFRTYALIPSAVMHNLHLGNFIVQKINATKRSCNILSDLNISSFKIHYKSADTCIIEGKICILSKIGTKMLWQIETSEMNTIELPSEDFSGMVINRIDNSGCLFYKKLNDYNKTK